MERYATTNRKHKDRLFISLFGNAERKKNTLELYNAVNGTHYDNPDDITIYTIEDALYLGMKNDVAFLISCRMNLYEHQSTPNPNIPVRGLMYLAKLYDKYIETQTLNIYGGKRLSLPTPQFVVFYNGVKNRPEKELLRLTDLFDQPDISCVEVTATVLNVNEDKNPALMQQSETLAGYAHFISLLRRYHNELPLEAATEKAISECIRNGILADYLLARKAEVFDMVLTEYDEEKVHRMFYNDGRAEGRAEGIATGRAEALRKMTDYLLAQNKSLSQEEAQRMAEDILKD